MRSIHPRDPHCNEEPGMRGARPQRHRVPHLFEKIEPRAGILDALVANTVLACDGLQPHLRPGIETEAVSRGAHLRLCMVSARPSVHRCCDAERSGMGFLGRGGELDFARPGSGGRVSRGTKTSPGGHTPTCGDGNWQLATVGPAIRVQWPAGRLQALMFTPA